jgi:hypothetical protein
MFIKTWSMPTAVVRTPRCLLVMGRLLPGRSPVVVGRTRRWPVELTLDVWTAVWTAPRPAAVSYAGGVSDRKVAVQLFDAVAAAHFDDLLATTAGMKRRPGSLNYIRRVPDGRQKIVFFPYVHPRYASDSFHLTMQCRMHYTAMAAILTAMGDHHAGSDAMVDTKDIDSQILGRPHSPRWLYRDEAGLLGYVETIRRVLVGAAVPYLDRRNSIRALSETWWAQWRQQRLRADHHLEPGRRPLQAAAGHLAVGDLDTARHILETAYPPGCPERDQYQQAFTAVAEAPNILS